MGATPNRDCATCGMRLSLLRWEGEIGGYACGHCQLYYRTPDAAPEPLRVQGVEYFDDPTTWTTDADTGDSVH